MARVHPVTDEIWDIRSVDPKPGIRTLGSFAEKDTFIALTWEYRENLESSRDWENEIARAKEAWKKLFGSVPPFKGANLDEYLSNCRII